MTKKGKGISFWLIPSDEYFEKYDKLIERLSCAMEAARLDPHVTIYVGELADGESAKDLLNEVLKDRSSFTLKINGWDYAAKFSQSFYLTLGLTDRLSQLSERFRVSSQLPSDYYLNPHMSLFYKSDEMIQKEVLSKQLDLNHEEVKFDKIRVVEHDKVIETKEDIEAFSLITECQLG